MGRIVVKDWRERAKNDWRAFKLAAAKDAEMRRRGRTREKVLHCLKRSKGSRDFLDRTCGKLSDYPVGDRGGANFQKKLIDWTKLRPRFTRTPHEIEAEQYRHGAIRPSLYFDRGGRWRPPPYLSGSYGDLGGTFVGGSKFNRSSSLPNRDAARKAMAYYKLPVLQGISADRGDAMGAKGDRGGIGGVAMPFIPPRYREMRMKGEQHWRGDRGGRKTKSLGGLSIAEWLAKQNGGRRPCPMKKCMAGYGCGKPDRWGCSGCGKCPERNPIYT